MKARTQAIVTLKALLVTIPASSGMTTRHRLNRGGRRQASAALYRTVIVRTRFHQPTIDYVARRTAGRQDHDRGHPLRQRSSAA